MLGARPLPKPGRIPRKSDRPGRCGLRRPAGSNCRGRHLRESQFCPSYTFGKPLRADGASRLDGVDYSLLLVLPSALADSITFMTTSSSPWYVDFFRNDY